MKRNLLVLLALNASIASIANADLISVGVVQGPFQHPDGLHQTWRIIARFDNTDDRIMAVVGLPNDEYNTINFEASSNLYNHGAWDNLSILEDFPTAGPLGGLEWDSYITIGATEFPHNIMFTPNFLGDWWGGPPPIMVILGDQWEESDGAWYYFGAPPLVGQFDSIDGNETIDVVIAQFTLLKGSAFTFAANVAWIPTVGDYVITPFETKVIPAPATLAMLIFAGLATNRRRRD